MIKLKVVGMTCAHCTQAVGEALAGVAGVEKVIEVSRERGEALLEGNPKEEDLLRAVRDEGYQAEVEH